MPDALQNACAAEPEAFASGVDKFSNCKYFCIETKLVRKFLVQHVRAPTRISRVTSDNGKLSES